jgi:hypothetical protein
MDVSKYEFLQELQYFSQRNSKAPHYAKNLKSTTAKVAVTDDYGKVKDFEHDIADAGNEWEISKIWMARRRRDDKVREPYLSVMDQIVDRKRCTASFLARAFEDRNGLVHSTKESLLRLLNHPNLVSLVDVIHDKEIAGGSIDYTIWEYCDKEI